MVTEGHLEIRKAWILNEERIQLCWENGKADVNGTSSEIENSEGGSNGKNTR
jgi:hypothetical protein